MISFDKYADVEWREQKMSSLKNSYLSLRYLFENDLTVNHIAEAITAINSSDSIEKAKAIMNEKSFDILGIKENGIIIGYVTKEDLNGESGIRTIARTFQTGEIVSETTSLIEVLFLLKETERIFVLEGNNIDQLVTRADIQKVPVRLLLFGLVSILEMNFSKIIRTYLPNDSWKQYLSESRIKKAELMFEDRKRKNQEIDLCDCLQFCDKREIILNDKKLFSFFEFESKNKGKETLKELEDLRDHIAHAQDLMNSFGFDKLIALVEKMETLLGKCERISSRGVVERP